MQLLENASLRPHNTFAVAARSRYLAYIDHPQELKVLLAKPHLQHLPHLILGSGSNILLRQNFDGLVIIPKLLGKTIIAENADHVYIRAGSGEIWHDFVLHTLNLGYSGLENLSLIPGTVGAAPMQNIGAYGVELQEHFDSLEALHLVSGELETFDKTACQFAYRSSVFKTRAYGQYMICSVTVKLPKQARFVLTYKGVQTELEQLGGALSAKKISQAICNIRRSKLPDPAQLGNAGSFFKNPVIDALQFQQLQQNFSTLPGYPQTEQKLKIPAAWLIEHCGWKGYREGDAGIHNQHALVLVNYGKATGQQLWQLAQRIQASVQQRFGIELEPEPLVL